MSIQFPFAYEKVLVWKNQKRIEINNKTVSSYCYHFWELREIICKCNQHMATIKSMSICFHKWACTGWVFYSSRSHPFGNEYHTVFVMCQESCLWCSKNWLREFGDPEFGDNVGKAACSLLHLCRSSIHLAFYDVLDSWFFIVETIFGVEKTRCFFSGLD